MTTTKKHLAATIAQSTGAQKYIAEQATDAMFTVMREQLAEGNRIEIRGFGAFAVKLVKPKPAARNPRTGEMVYVPARRKTHFKPGALLKEAMHREGE